MRHCIKKCISAILTVSMLISCLTGCEKINSTNEKTLSHKIDEYVRSFNKSVTDYQISGTIIISKDNNIVFKNSYGKADYEKDVPFNDNTVFRIASITKLFTAVAIMQLYEGGQLSLTDPISKYIPGQIRGEDITIHSLLTHTSGIERESGVDANSYNTKADIINSIIKKPLRFEPGTDIEYSNAGYNLLAAVIEKVSGQSYSDYIKENIFIPANMKSSGCDLAVDSIPNLAAGYNYKNGIYNKESEVNLSFAFGAGEIFSSALDMINFDKALHSGRILSKQSTEKMFQDNANMIKYGDIFGYGSNTNDLNGHKWYGKSGNLLTFSSYYVRFPKENIAIIILLNTWFPINDQLKEIISAIALGESYKLPLPKEEITLEEALLKKYEGNYESERDTFIHLKTNRLIQLKAVGNHLVDKQTQGYELSFIPYSTTEFCLKGIEFIECKFEEDKSGNVIGLAISNGTEKVHFKKLK